ncbi:GNAT family N-acetyltransferase [Actinopolyspora mortivallis]|uniref:GNAT family N-acetyltransferase n=1 Tax=Actinopolyspora mortivallis TaxID=33906 RepID=UPI0015E61B34|nr:N-acetyltransferase [Actinopolyspora mortivallis]
MTAAPSPRCERVVELSTEELRARLPEAVRLYVTAMGYPSWTTQQRIPVWSAHMSRSGWRCVAAFNDRDELSGIGYGYSGDAGQWWHEQVRRGMQEHLPPDQVKGWLDDYFELTELHVHPEAQGHGLGRSMLRTLLSTAPGANVLLSTPEGPTRAWRLYRRMGFTDILRNHRFMGDPRPFAVLGRSLPLDT